LNHVSNKFVQKTLPRISFTGSYSVLKIFRMTILPLRSATRQIVGTHSVYWYL